MKYAIALIAVLVAITITSHDAHASTDTSLNWSYGSYGTSELLKMSPAYVLRSEHGYDYYPIARPVLGAWHHKMMGEGETHTPEVNRWIINQINSEMTMLQWQQSHPVEPVVIAGSQEL